MMESVWLSRAQTRCQQAKQVKLLLLLLLSLLAEQRVATDTAYLVSRQATNDVR